MIEADVKADVVKATLVNVEVVKVAINPRVTFLLFSKVKSNYQLQ